MCYIMFITALIGLGTRFKFSYIPSKLHLSNKTYYENVTFYAGYIFKINLEFTSITLYKHEQQVAQGCRYNM